MVWGVYNAGIKRELLEPLGLVCRGGAWSGVYTIRGIRNNFVVDLPISDINEIEKIYTKWLRKNKLNKIENR
jgi:hypothetical protein